MCWYLYSWGRAVEFLQSKELRDLVHAYRRDFSALP